MAYTKKPKDAPAFDAAAFTKALATGAKIGPNLVTQYIAWKQWVESTNAYASADDGGLRAVLKADALAVDKLKGDVDAIAQVSIEMRADIQALKEAPAARPFPGG